MLPVLMSSVLKGDNVDAGAKKLRKLARLLLRVVAFVFAQLPTGVN